MKISKINGTYNDYKVEMSFGQLTAIKNALATEHADPLADELYAELNWYLDNIPGPGESEDDLKAQEEAGASGMDSPEAADNPLKASADKLLPAPGEEEGGDQPDMPPAAPEPDTEPGGGEGEAPGGGAPPEDSAPDSEADSRLPEPPAE